MKEYAVKKNRFTDERIDFTRSLQRREIAGVAMDFIPFVGSAKSGATLISGRDWATGTETSRGMELVGIVAGLFPGDKALTRGKNTARVAGDLLEAAPLTRLAKIDHPYISMSIRNGLEPNRWGPNEHLLHNFPLNRTVAPRAKVRGIQAWMKGLKIDPIKNYGDS